MIGDAGSLDSTADHDDVFGCCTHAEAAKGVAGSTSSNHEEGSSSGTKPAADRHAEPAERGLLREKWQNDKRTGLAIVRRQVQLAR